MFRKMCEHSNGWRPEDGVPDLAMMSNITAEGINLNLRTRYKRDEIYTFSGSILIAVNPYKQLEIYNSRWVARYRQQKLDQTDPHIFALTEAMYMNLVMQDHSQHDGSISSSPHKIRKDDTSQQFSASIESKPSRRTSSSTQPSTSTVGVKNQACVISGESGAGKTETTKFILSYLCSVTPNKSIWMEHQILEANTILEAFGNAKTVRNDNSSRFGKFIQICFDSRHQINGCIIQDYLLEQSRITYQSIDERNYHVFYQLLAAGQANQELRRKFHLMPANFYDYLNKTQCYTIEGVNDCSMFDSLRTAMSVLNMEQEKCDGLFGVLSAILWLGNLQFRCDESNRSEQCQLTENDLNIVKIVSELLGINREKLVSILLRRQINVRGTITEIPLKIHEALDNRNAMAKALYSRLFTWVVNFINASTNPGLDNTCFLGVLDIFGFENFDSNSFEQLCINYANEKLHKFFNHHMFAMEQELYKREEIEFCDINYTDNTPCLELLEKPPSCILRLLSEECRMPKGNDVTFIDKLHTEFSVTNPNPFYVKGYDRRNWCSEFSIRHFAGTVTYNVSGFLKKNKDTQQSQLLDIIETADNPLLRDLVDFHSNRDQFTDQSSLPNQQQEFELARNGKLDNLKTKLQSQNSFCIGAMQANSFESNSRRESSSGLNFPRQSSLNSISMTNSSKSKTTVADTFRHQLTSLVELLNSVNPWYVRCIKPNLEKSATDFDDRQVLTQLNYLGMTDLIRIRREGYPIHLTKHQFVCRYRCLMLKHLRKNPAISPLKLEETKLELYCLRIINHFGFDTSNWKIGKTMVLLRTHIYQELEEKRNNLFVEMATLIQSFWRGQVQRREFYNMRCSAIRIQETFRAFRGRLLYLRKKRAVLTIQAYCRGMFAREIANALREIKRVEKEEALKAAKEEGRLKAKQLLEEQEATKRLESSKTIEEESTTEIVITYANQDDGVERSDDEHLEKQFGHKDGVSPISNVSPAVSSSASWNGQELTSESKQRLLNARDKKEMDELVKVLERHGISLDALEQGNETTYADFEKLYDVLGSHLQTNCDIQSISPSVNDDDRCSFATTGTNCDGDSVSCSGQSQISSTLTDCDDDKKISNNCYSNSQEQISDTTHDHTVNQKHNAQNLDHDKYHSNSIESIASIASSGSSIHSHQHAQNQHLEPSDQPLLKKINESTSCSQPESTLQVEPARTSTFTGNSLMVGGSKIVSNGRPLTRIEEEPNSMASSPSKTPCRSTPRPQSLFPPQESDENLEGENRSKAEQNSDIKKRRIERRILQVQQEQLHPINPTTNGVPTSASINNISSNNSNDGISNSNDHSQNQLIKSGETEAIYAVEKNNIIEYAEQRFNNHLRDSSSGIGVMRTLTRRRKSVDSTGCGEYLSRAEMLSYNPTFAIPTSHIKMHDPHNSQLSCSIFKNLCKYMTGESAKSDNEIRIIQSVIRHGIEKTELRDEIYVQITRQLTNNPNHDHCLRLWVLLGLVSAAFSPSKNFSKHLVAYLRSKPRKDPSITCHAQFCLDNLQAPRLAARKYPPSVLEIQACKNLTNLTCKIHLLDGRCETLSIHPCDTALDALTKLAHRINLQSIEGWALYESYTPGASKYPHPSFENSGDFERTVRAHYFMADLVASWQEGVPRKVTSNASLRMAQKRLDEGNFKLTLKKRIFRGPKIRNDPVEISLLYAQAVYNVVKKDCYFVDESLAVSLAGLQAQAALGNAANVLNQTAPAKRSKNTSKLVSKPPNQVYDFENYICVRLRNVVSRSKKDWCNSIAQAHKQFHNVNEVFCKMRYLSMVIYHCPLYGTATFDVTYKGYQTIEQNLMLGVNAEGLVLIRSSDKALINAYRYSDICQERGIIVYTEEHIIQLNVQDRADGTLRCLSFESGENEEIAMLITSYSPMLNVYVRGSSKNTSFTMDSNFDQNVVKRKAKLKMTLEDRMRAHQEVQNARKAIIRSGKLRKPNLEESNPSLLKHTLRRLSSTKTKNDKNSRFENIYGTLGKSDSHNIPQTSSDYNLHGNLTNQVHIINELHQSPNEVAGATAATVVDELTKAYPHRYWAYTKTPLKNSLLTIYDPELEEAALVNFTSILLYSGLANQSESSSCTSTLETSSIDSGIVSQQSLSNLNSQKHSNGSPSSVSSSDIYDVCPRKMDEKDLIRLAQGILDRCLKKDADILKNEFFLQLIKQTTDHPDPNSEINKRHWQLLALACSVTYPSDNKILAYLYAHLRRCSLDQVTDEGQFSQFTLRSLQGTLDTKGRRLAPSEMEIISTINCRRVYARVYFLDGQFQAVEFDPCATIAEVVEQIKQKIGLKPECLGYALFQPLDDDCEQVLQPEDKVGDAIAAWENWQRRKQPTNDRQAQSQSNGQSVNTNAINKTSLIAQAPITKNKTHRFLFKRYLFMDNIMDLNDPVERELQYFQTVASIKEDKFPVLDQEATILCALKAQIEIGDYTKLSNLPKEHIRMVYKQVVMSLMPPHAFNNLPLPAIAQQHQAFRDLSCVDTKKYFFNLIQSFGRANYPNKPGYILLHRAHIYDATQTFATAWPSDIWIVINHSGLHMLVARSRRILAICEYRQIVDYSANNNYLIIIMLTNTQNTIKYTLYTKHAQQIAQQMKDYIVILSSSGGKKRRKSVEFNLKQQASKPLDNSESFAVNSSIQC